MFGFGTARVVEISQEDYENRMRKFVLEMNMMERFAQPITGLCDQGRIHFEPFCTDPTVPAGRSFISHIKDDCGKCERAFLKHLLLVTEDS